MVVVWKSRFSGLWSPVDFAGVLTPDLVARRESGESDCALRASE